LNAKIFEAFFISASKSFLLRGRLKNK